MYKKVLKTMLILIAVFLFALYLVKFIFPEQFMMVIQNPIIVSIGEYIDTHVWLYHICAVFTSLLTYWLYLCALTHKWCLNWKELIAVLIVIGVTHGLYYVDASLTSGWCVIAMLALPLIFGADFKETVIVFSFNYAAQLLSTLIRNLPMFLVNVNFMTIFLMTIEQYFWLLLFYIYFNLNKEANHGNNQSTIVQN